ncbi:MAG: phosphonate C-P lyase system protein PhnL [Pseudomonadota bacterium]
MTAVLKISGASKSFCLHLQGQAKIEAFSALDFTLHAGEAVGLSGPSGAGKSSLLKLIYGTYPAGAGSVEILHDRTWVDIVTGTPSQVMEVRRRTLGYVTQFLRVIPRVPCLDIVAEPLIERGANEKSARSRARELLVRLNIPEKLWSLSPLTFSGGEQQRVNIARGFAVSYPILLLDEPTASLDAENRQVVLDLIAESVAAGSAMIGIFHDTGDRAAVSTREFDISRVRRAA